MDVTGNYALLHRGARVGTLTTGYHVAGKSGTLLEIGGAASWHTNIDKAMDRARDILRGQREAEHPQAAAAKAAA